jgi:hypothetical protein
MLRNTMLRRINPNHTSGISSAYNSMIRRGAAALLGRGDLRTDSSENVPCRRPGEPPIGGDPLSMTSAYRLIAAVSMSEVSILLDL